jgi:hypothetical protein
MHGAQGPGPWANRSEKNSVKKPSLACCLFFDYLHGIFFDPDDGSSMFLRNVGELLTDYTALHTKDNKLHRTSNPRE